LAPIRMGHSPGYAWMRSGRRPVPENAYRHGFVGIRLTDVEDVPGLQPVHRGLYGGLTAGPAFPLRRRCREGDTKYEAPVLAGAAT